MLYHMEEDNRYTQNIQINEVIGENEKCVLYIMKKTKWTFCPTQYYAGTQLGTQYFFNISLSWI